MICEMQSGPHYVLCRMKKTRSQGPKKKRAKPTAAIVETKIEPSALVEENSNGHLQEPGKEKKPMPVILTEANQPDQNHHADLEADLKQPNVEDPPATTGISNGGDDHEHDVDDVCVRFYERNNNPIRGNTATDQVKMEVEVLPDDADEEIMGLLVSQENNNEEEAAMETEDDEAAMETEDDEAAMETDDDDDDDDDYEEDWSLESFANELFQVQQSNAVVDEANDMSSLLPNRFFVDDWVRGWELIGPNHVQPTAAQLGSVRPLM